MYKFLSIKVQYKIYDTCEWTHGRELSCTDSQTSDYFTRNILFLAHAKMLLQYGEITGSVNNIGWSELLLTYYGPHIPANWYRFLWKDFEASATKWFPFWKAWISKGESHLVSGDLYIVYLQRSLFYWFFKVKMDRNIVVTKQNGGCGGWTSSPRVRKRKAKTAGPIILKSLGFKLLDFQISFMTLGQPTVFRWDLKPRSRASVVVVVSCFGSLF